LLIGCNVASHEFFWIPSINPTHQLQLPFISVAQLIQSTCNTISNKFHMVHELPLQLLELG
jgi:hypothetical protein